MQNQVLNCDDMSELMKVLSGASEKWKITKIKGYGALNWVLLGFSVIGKKACGLIKESKLIILDIEYEL